MIVKLGLMIGFVQKFIVLPSSPTCTKPNVSCRFLSRRKTKKMIIVTTKGQFNTDSDGVVLVFNNDDELSSFISMIVKTPVRMSGMRILPLIPENVQLNPLQIAVLNVIEGLDGFGGSEHEKIVDDSIDNLKDILNG